MSRDKGRNLVPTNEKKRVQINLSNENLRVKTASRSTPVNLGVGFAFEEHARLRSEIYLHNLLSFGRGIATL